MKVLVDRLTATPSTHSFEGSESWWRDRTGAADGLGLPEAFSLELRAYTMAEDILLEGELTGHTEAECSRCLSRYRHPLRDAFRLVLEPAGDRAPADPESAAALAQDGLCLGDELEAGWYRGRELHLDAFVAELISLALPIQALCCEDCAGLCSVCGTDQNQSPCECAESRSDSPFAVLAALRGGRDGGAP